jgi:hypothetical protein
MAFDHNKDDVSTWAQEMWNNTGDGSLAGFVDGLAVHWYTGEFERDQKKGKRVHECLL